MKALLIALTVITLTAAPRTALAADPSPIPPPDPTMTSTALGVQGLSDGEAVKIRRIIETQTQDLMANNFDNYALAWAEDGVLMPLGHPRVIGRDAIVDFVEANYPGGTMIRYSDWDVAGRDDLAVATNNARIAFGGEPQEPQFIDQIIVLRRHADGRWLVQTAIWTLDRPG